MRISIAMATYNGGRYLQEQLDSFLAQTRLPDQLVITDDQSQDDTVAIARAFARKVPFDVLVEVNSRRLGVTCNFDRALSLCDGDLVLLSDQDDVWFPEKIATLVEMSRSRSGVACWFVDALLVDRALVPVGGSKMERIRQAGLPETAMVMGCCAAFRRDLLQILLPIPAGEPAHDTWLVQVSDLLSLVERAEIPMQYYRRHDRNVSQMYVNRIDPLSVGERLGRPIQKLLKRALMPGGLEREHQFMVLAISRLVACTDALRVMLGSRADTAIAAAVARASLLERRLAIRALPRSHRPGPVIGLWRRGAYRASGGLGGACKDMLLS